MTAQTPIPACASTRIDASGRGTPLAFTGLDLGLYVLLAAELLSGGAGVARFGRRRPV